MPGWTGSDADVFGSTDDGLRQTSALRSALEWGAVIIGALLAAILIKTFLFQAFFIPSESMVPTLKEGDRILVNKLAYRFGDVAHGDIVVFHRPEGVADTGPDEFVKRVIGLPGDTVEARDGVVFVNDEPVDESYLPTGVVTNGLPRQVVPEGRIFVMGDNRGSSQDSRVFGPVPIDTIVGEAFVRVWPLGALGGL